MLIMEKGKLLFVVWIQYITILTLPDKNVIPNCVSCDKFIVSVAGFAGCILGSQKREIFSSPY